MPRWTPKQLRQYLAAPRARKYHNEPTVVEGIRFDSRKEAIHYHRLLLQQCAGLIAEIERQPRYPLIVNGEKIGAYVADFRVKYPDGREEVQDVKGLKTPVYKLKKRLMRALYNIEIVEIT